MGLIVGDNGINLRASEIVMLNAAPVAQLESSIVPKLELLRQHKNI